MLDLSAIIEGREKELETRYGYVPADDGKSAVLPDNVRLTKPIAVDCRVTENHGYVTIRAEARADYETPCDRCLEPVTSSVTVEVERYVETGVSLRNPEDGDDGDVLPLENGCVDLDPALTEEILLALPMLHLCAPDCPGLCPRCGKKRVPGGCSCPQEGENGGQDGEMKKEIDPRMAIFAKLLEK